MDEENLMIIVACVIAAAIPLAALFGIYKLDKFKTGEFRLVLFCFAAGAIAYGAAAFINPLPRKLGWINYNQMVRFLAPVVEEALKAAILFILVRRPKFTYFVDGAVYGFAVGIAFAVIENMEYIFGNPGAAMLVAINRVISTNLMHAAACAIAGIVLGWARFRKPFPRITLSIGGVLLAMALHLGYNNLVTRVTSGLLLIYAVGVGAGAAALIVVMIRRGFKEEQHWIEDTLNVSVRVERQEMLAVQDIGKVNDVKKRITAIFGTETAETMNDLLITQAHLGIQIKAAEKMTDEKLKMGINAEVTQLREKMEAVRKKIGPYAMAYLRYTHLEEMASVYSALSLKLQDLAAQPRSAGPSLYERLSQRMVPLKQDDTQKQGQNDS